MKKKNYIVFFTSLILIMLIISPVVNAGSIKDMIQISNLTQSQPDGINAVSILGTIKWVGYIVGIGMFVWVGIKYLLSGAGEKAKAKETLIPLLVGAILVTTGTAITAAVFSMFGYN